jgi:hypothetical protein
MELSIGQSLGKRICEVFMRLDLSDRDYALGLVLTNKVIRQSNGFLVQAAARVSRIQHNRHVVDPDWGRLACLNTHRSKKVIPY